MSVPWGAVRKDTGDSPNANHTSNGFTDREPGRNSGAESGFRGSSSNDNAPSAEVKVMRVPAATTKEDLTAIFESVGQVLRVNILQPRDGYDTTMAFVRFSDLSEAESAVENMNGFEVEGKELKVEIAQSRKSREDGDGQSKSFGDRSERRDDAPRFSDQEGKQVRVLNIATSLSEDDVSTYFQAAGNVVSVRLLPPKDGYSTVAGFLTFGETNEANTAVETLNNTTLEGQTLRVELAKSRSNNQNRSGGDDAGASGAPWKRAAQNDTIDGERVCRRCQKPGHMAHACPDGGNCFKCGSPDHQANSCTAIQEDGRGPFSGGSDITCHRCGEIGHMSRECPSAGENPGPVVTYIPPEPSNAESDIFLHTTPQGINFEKYNKIPVELTGNKVVKPISSFQQADLHPQCLANVVKSNYLMPTPVQKYALPVVAAGRDLMACAQTGSGKTAAFLLPIISQLLKGGPPPLDEEFPVHPLVLVIAPTRELAVQISLEVRKFTYGAALHSCVVYGGVKVSHQLNSLRTGHHIVVGTPGRLNDFISKGQISLSQLQFFIMDEADRMLDMGFLPQMQAIYDNPSMPPKHIRRTLMFSATFPEDIQRLAAELMHDYLFLTVGRVGATSSDIEQNIMQVDSMQKRDTLERILSETGTDRTLVFVDLKRSADFLASYLSQKDFPTTSISSDRTQQERESALEDFRRGIAVVMVATAVAARGLDIEGIKHVINYDLPQTIEEYVHRIGRTGRIGNKGKATSFYDFSRDDRLSRGLVKVLSEAAQVVPEWLENAAMSAVGTGYGPAGGQFSSRDTRERPPRGQNTRFQNGNGADEEQRAPRDGFQREQRAPVSSTNHNEAAAESWD